MHPEQFNFTIIFRSPITEILRTPIVAADEPVKKKEDNLMKKLAEKLISTAISNDEDNKKCEDKVAVKKVNEQKKNLIFEDDDEDFDIYSTPPKKSAVALKDGPVRTPLSCVGNTNTPKSIRSFIPTSTPKSKFNFNDENSKSVSRIPVSSRRLH